VRERAEVLDYQSVRNRRRTIQDLAAGLTRADLVMATNAMLDEVLRRIDGVTDAGIAFVPEDPAAHDEYASDPEAVGLPWTLGHVIVHLTASAEEAAFLAAELARGVVREGRSRWETPWETVTTMAMARARIAESRRMLQAMLGTWPDPPHLDVVIVGGSGPRNAVARHLSGLSHADSHLGQVSEIVRQVAEAGARSQTHPGSG
jgi:hypothetical protein